MSSVWTNHATDLAHFLDNNNETQAHMYLEQLMLFPVDIQDKIIEEISHLVRCSSEDIARIITHYSMMEIQ